MAEHTRRKAARAKLSKMGYAQVGGHMKDHPDEAEDKKLIKKEVAKARIKLKSGGAAEGNEPKPRADRMSRGGKSKGHKGGHTTVNVVVAGQHPKPVPVPVPKPVPVPVAAGPGAGGPPPEPMPMPPGQDPNAPPMGLKRGGRAKRADSGSADLKMESQRDKIKGLPDGQFKKGGRTRMPVPMDSGAGGGKGRLEKIKDYG